MFHISRSRTAGGSRRPSGPPRLPPTVAVEEELIGALVWDRWWRYACRSAASLDKELPALAPTALICD